MESNTSKRETELADLAHYVLCVARDIFLFTHQQEKDLIEITRLESLVMSRVERKPDITPSQLGNEIGIRSSNLSTIIRVLEKKGLIQRLPDLNDRRSVVLRVTPLASNNLNNARKKWASFLGQHIDESVDLESMINFLRELDDSVTETAEYL